MSIDCCQLHVHSRYSFKDGQDPVEDLVVRAKEMGQPAMGLTDHGVLFGAPDLFVATKKHGIKGIIGMEAYEAVPHAFDLERDKPIFDVKWSDLNGRDRYYHLTLWVTSAKGWENLCALHTQAHTAAYYPTVRGKPLIDRASLERHSEGLAVGMGCIASRFNVTLGRSGEDAAYEAAKWTAGVFQGRCWMELMGNTPEQIALIRGQRRIAAKLGIPCVAVNDVHYRDQEDGVENGSHHILVQARKYRSKDTEESGDKSDDGFGSWYGSDQFFMKSGKQMLATQGMTAADVEQTLAVADLVDFEFDKLPKPKPPVAVVPAPGDDPGFDLWLEIHT